MSETLVCSECGSRITDEASRGLCPKCLPGDAAPSTAAYRPPASPAASDVPGPPPTIDAFRRAVLDLGLVGPDVLDAHIAEAKGDLAALAKSLARAGLLTSYQAGALAQGRARGLVVGPYLVLKKRGQGGMGVVFKARHRRSCKVVALKILLPSFGRDREAVRRFRREFEVAARLDHPNIVAALEASEDRGVQYLTMEYVEGNDLEDTVQAVGPLPVKMSIHCIIQAARGMAAAHAEGIVHRDLKPANLMLDASGQVRVLDLGLARVIEAANPMGRDAAGTLTQTGSYMGTVDFVSPEQANDSKKADHRADIYSLGCTLHFLLTGRPPFEADSILKRLMAHQQQPAPSLHAARGDVPEALETAYRAMMAKRPEDRPRSMDEVISLMEACRSSADEAKEARDGLRSFAETVMKRATPRKRGWGIDASVYARPSEGRLQFDPGLQLEDLVTDYRDEVKPRGLSEDELPPLLPRLAVPRRRAGRPQPLGPVLSLAAAGALAVAAFMYLPRIWMRPKPGARPAATAARLASAPAGPLPLFVGDDLKGWTTFGGTLADWAMEDGVLSSRPQAIGVSHLATERLYSDFKLRLEFQTSPGSDGGFMLMTIKPDGKSSDRVELLDIREKQTDMTWIWKGDAHERRVMVPVVTLKRDGDWNRLDVERRDGLIFLSVNGQAVHKGFAEVEGPQRIGFQNPGQAPIRYRKAMIEELAPGVWEPLFNGKDLAGWALLDGTSGDWRVEAGLPACKGSFEHDMRLFTDRTFQDFRLRFEYQAARGTNAGLLLSSVERVDQYRRIAEVELSDAEAAAELRPGTFFGVGDGSEIYRKAAGSLVRPAPILGGDAWNRVELSVIDGHASVAINGQALEYEAELPKLDGPQHVGFSCNSGSIRLRNVEVRELMPPPAALAHGDPLVERSRRLLFLDDYDRPRPYWTSTTPEELAKNPDHSWGHRDDIMFDETRTPAYYRGFLPAQFDPDFSVEVVGRVTGDKPTSRGGFLIQVVGKARGFQVMIDGTGALTVHPTPPTNVGYFNPWLGPIRHPAIVPGGAGYNEVRLLVRQRRLEIFVNGVRVCDPLGFDQDLESAWVSLGVEGKESTVRAEYDRVEVRALPAPVEPEPPASIQFFAAGSRLEPDGTHCYEGGGLHVSERTGREIYWQRDLQHQYQGQWTNDLYRLWAGEQAGDVLTFDIPVEAKGIYQVVGGFTLAPDFGRFKFALDGQPLIGDQYLDLYDPAVRPSEPMPLGTVPLAPGIRRLTVTIVGKHRASSGFRFGLDEIRLVPAR